MDLLRQNIEALIFASEASITLDEVKASLKITFGWEVTKEEIEITINDIKHKYATEEFPFELVEIAEGYQFLTKKEFHPTVSALIQHKARKRLSTSQMETLAIIAYKQPVSKAEIEHIRGVNCDYAVQKLLEKDLVEIQGKSDGPGRPLVYCTSPSFMDYFGIKSVGDLPLLKDLKVENENTIGEPETEQMQAVEEQVFTAEEPVTDEQPETEQPVAEQEQVEAIEEQPDVTEETQQFEDSEEQESDHPVAERKRDEPLPKREWPHTDQSEEEQERIHHREQ
jgi:segregation and condensation protein B